MTEVKLDGRCFSLGFVHLPSSPVEYTHIKHKEQAQEKTVIQEIGLHERMKRGLLSWLLHNKERLSEYQLQIIWKLTLPTFCLDALVFFRAKSEVNMRTPAITLAFPIVTSL